MEIVNNIPQLPARESDSHKGTYGRVLIIGGSEGMSGAPALAGKAALRSGSGLVRVGVGKTILPIVAGHEPCYTTIGLEDNEGDISYSAVNTILSELNNNEAVGFGPGIGINNSICDILDKLLRSKGLKIVVDADGLNNLCRINDWCSIKKAGVVLTPHPGEMKRLWHSVFRENMPEDRKQAAFEFSVKTCCVLVLKGHQTVVSDGKRVYVNTTGNPGMATAGSGDVLTGVITSLIGQGLDEFDASILGVYIHGLAGDKAAAQKGRISLTAADIIDFLPDAYVSYETEIL